MGAASNRPVAHVSLLFGTSASPGQEPGEEPQSPENNVKGEGSKDHWVGGGGAGP